MAVTQYIGARYVPLFADPIQWDSERTYEPLTIVLYQGNSYTSRQAVPIGIDISNDSYWAITGNYNAQIEQYRTEVSTFDGRITANENAIDAIEVAIPSGSFDATNTIADAIAANTGNISTIDAKIGSGFDATNTIASAIATETSTREGDVAEINGKIGSGFDSTNTIASAISNNTGDISTIDAKIGSGFDAVNTIASAIATETSTREGDVAEINGKIGSGFDSTNTIASAIANETSARDAADATLENAILMQKQVASVTKIPYAKCVARDAVAYNVGDESVGEGCCTVDISGSTYYALMVDNQVVIFDSIGTKISTTTLNNVSINGLCSYENKVFVCTLGATNYIITYTTPSTYNVSAVTCPASAMVSSNDGVVGFSQYDDTRYAYLLSHEVQSGSIANGNYVYGYIYAVLVSISNPNDSTNLGTLYVQTATLQQGCGYSAAADLWYVCVSGPNTCRAFRYDEDSSKFVAQELAFENQYNYMMFDELEDAWFDGDGNVYFCCKGITSVYSNTQTPMLPSMFKWDSTHMEYSAEVAGRSNGVVEVYLSTTYSPYNRDSDVYNRVNLRHATDIVAIAEAFPSLKIHVFVDSNYDEVLILPSGSNVLVDLNNHLIPGIYTRGCTFSVIDVAGNSTNGTNWPMTFNGKRTWLFCADSLAIVTGNWTSISTSSECVGKLERCMLVANSASSSSDYWNTVTSGVINY